MLVNLLLALIGLASGYAVSAGIFAFIMSLGIIERMADVSRTTKHIKLYETIVLLGAVSGNLLTVYEFNVPLGKLGAGFLGLFSGIFTGLIAIALVEILKSIPIMFRRAKIQKGLGVVVLCIALGKLCGSLLQYVQGWV